MMWIYQTVLYKLRRKWMKLHLQPSRVFCLYHVCEQYNSDAMYAHYFVKKWSNTSFRKCL